MKKNFQRIEERDFVNVERGIKIEWKKGINKIGIAFRSQDWIFT